MTGYDIGHVPWRNSLAGGQEAPGNVRDLTVRAARMTLANLSVLPPLLAGRRQLPGRRSPNHDRSRMGHTPQGRSLRAGAPLDLAPRSPRLRVIRILPSGPGAGAEMGLG